MPYLEFAPMENTELYLKLLLLLGLVPLRCSLKRECFIKKCENKLKQIMCLRSCGITDGRVNVENTGVNSN